jgi:hypothetical protein
MRKRAVLITFSCLLLFYVSTYAVLYANRGPAANLGYFVYTHGGVEKEGQERILFRFYYPVYKVHRLFGIGRHNYDRPNVDGEGLYDGDEPKK